MKNSKHTPGPWNVIHSSDHKVQQTFTVGMENATYEQKPYNEKVINAAPELLNEHISDIDLIKFAMDAIRGNKPATALSHLECILTSKERVIKKATEL